VHDSGSEPPQRVEIVVSTRTVLRVLAVAFAFLALLYLLYLVRSVLVLVLISTFLAISINPLVTIVERKLRLSRGPAVVLVFLTLLILFGAFLTALLTPLYSEVRQFAENVPDYLEQLQDSRLFRDLDREYDILDKLQAQAENLPARLPDTAGSLLGLAGAVFSAILTFVTVMFLTVFILLELPALGRSILGLLYPDSADRANRIAADVNVTIARWVAGTLIVATFAGVAMYIACTIMGVPFAIVLALLVAVFDLIPLVGATIGAIVVVAVAFTQGVTEGVVMLIFSLVYQQVENQIIQPIVMKRSVSVSPFIVLTSVLIGSSLLGVIGALLAIPFAGSIQIALREVLEARRSQVQGARDALATAERAPPVDVDLALEPGLPPTGHAGDPPPLR
jgi:predicted PurR-regulated permease PerM